MQIFCRIKTKSKKWYRRVLFHFLDLSLINSYILYKEICRDLNKKIPKLFEFKLEVALALMYGAFGTAERLPPPQPIRLAENGDPIGGDVSDAVRLDGFNHLPEFVANFSRRCKLPGCLLRTRLWCMKCHVYLCSTKDRNCFQAWHTEHWSKRQERDAGGKFSGSK